MPKRGKRSSARWPIDAGGGDARDRLRRLFALAGSRRELPAVELAIRDWARRDAAHWPSPCSSGTR